jgi:hypothetical protein
VNQTFKKFYTHFSVEEGRFETQRQVEADLKKLVMNL